MKNKNIGKARLGLAWQDEARRGTARHGTANFN